MTGSNGRPLETLTESMTAGAGGPITIQVRWIILLFLLYTDHPFGIVDYCTVSSHYIISDIHEFLFWGKGWVRE